MKLCILISAFCFLTSVGLGLDAAVDTIVSPAGAIDVGQAVVPRCVVHAYTGSGPVEVHFLIPDEGYHDSLTLPPMPPGFVDTVTFGSWIPHGRDSMTAVAWTECPGDTYPQNDTFRQRFFLRIKDIGLSDLWPSGNTFDSGQVIVPHVRVSNLGNVALFFRLWRDSMLLPPGEDTVIYADSLTCVPGIWTIQAFVVVVGDLHPWNNFIVDTFYVRGTMFESLWVRVLMPDTVDTGDIVTPRVRAGNSGVNPAAFWLQFNIYDSAGRALFPADSSQMMLGPGDSTETEYWPISFSEPGMYLAVALAFIEPGHAAADSHYFWVVPGSGVEEAANGEGRKANGGVSVLRRLPPGAVVFDAMGRRVVNPKPGVYFVREEPSAASRQPSAVTVRKVIIQR
jgi:hypothetical protein